MSTRHGTVIYINMQKIKINLRGWGFSLVVERLPRKRKALGSVPSSEKKKKKKSKIILLILVKTKWNCKLTCGLNLSALVWALHLFLFLNTSLELKRQVLCIMASSLVF